MASNNRLFLSHQSRLDGSITSRRKHGGPKGLAWCQKVCRLLEQVPVLTTRHKPILSFGYTLARRWFKRHKQKVFQRFDIPASYDRSKFSCGFEIRAAGFHNSILLMTKKVHEESGKYIMYNSLTLTIFDNLRLFLVSN